MMAFSRLVLLLICFLTLLTFPTLLTLLHSHPRGEMATESLSATKKGTIHALFSFHPPSTLFPPSAIISLTDDNSTFFLARPADFGSSLPSKGFSGELWVGSGFGDDHLGRDGMAAGVEGELGCSDVPGWENGGKHRRGNPGAQAIHVHHAAIEDSKDQARQRGFQVLKADPEMDLAASSSLEDDGTDDHLHQPLSNSLIFEPAPPGGGSGLHKPLRTPSFHADIQSLQESAEISGKIVLLSRGGCGFLEKAKWAQRRGGTALIVGDDTRGAALITMYARGDTSNVTIPSLFTSYTTAHLLSSLIPPGGLFGGIGLATLSKPDQIGGISRQDPSEKIEGSSHEKDHDRPVFTTVTNVLKPIATAAPKLSASAGYRKSVKKTRKESSSDSIGWFKSMLSHIRSRKQPRSAVELENSRRPPSSGRLSWLSDKWSDEAKESRSPSAQSKSGKQAQHGPQDHTEPSPDPSSADDFVIGVQDWRDPDLVSAKSSQNENVSSLDKGPTQSIPRLPETTSSADKIPDRAGSTLAGGINTPGSGEYLNNGYTPQQSDVTDQNKKANQSNRKGQPENDDLMPSKSTQESQTQAIRSGNGDGDDRIEDHQGLWITLTPTTVSTSPFFDTLLVLVVSPLITLTVVYALLLLRSRIRRRRWRAPKSVVDRLPVRTYHTMSCSSTPFSSQQPSPKASSPASPLLQTGSQALSSHSRPRSPTTSGISNNNSLSSFDQAQSKTSLPPKGRQKHTHSSSNYANKQIECVVCLEEYVDGYSRVMSLPCGHEFHVECITPWLTTRRRTCPICKGDVVRPMTRPLTSAEAAVPRDRRRHNIEDDTQSQICETVNDSYSAAIPIPRDLSAAEEGDDMAATLVNDDPEASSPRRGWRDLASLSLSAFSGEAAWRQAQADRDR